MNDYIVPRGVKCKHLTTQMDTELQVNAPPDFDQLQYEGSIAVWRENRMDINVGKDNHKPFKIGL